MRWDETHRLGAFGSLAPFLVLVAASALGIVSDLGRGQLGTRIGATRRPGDQRQGGRRRAAPARQSERPARRWHTTASVDNIRREEGRKHVLLLLSARIRLPWWLRTAYHLPARSKPAPLDARRPPARLCKITRVPHSPPLTQPGRPPLAWYAPPRVFLRRTASPGLPEGVQAGGQGVEGEGRRTHWVDGWVVYVVGEW